MHSHCELTDIMNYCNFHNHDTVQGLYYALPSHNVDTVECRSNNVPHTVALMLMVVAAQHVVSDSLQCNNEKSEVSKQRHSHVTSLIIVGFTPADSGRESDIEIYCTVETWRHICIELKGGECSQMGRSWQVW